MPVAGDGSDEGGEGSGAEAVGADDGVALGVEGGRGSQFSRGAGFVAGPGGAGGGCGLGEGLGAGLRVSRRRRGRREAGLVLEGSSTQGTPA